MMPFVVMEAEVAPVEKRVLGSVPSFFPATALMPACAPMVGLAATLGTTVIPELLWLGLTGLLWKRMAWVRSPKSYCPVVFSRRVGFSFFRESAFNESAGWPTWLNAITRIPTNKINKKHLLLLLMNWFRLSNNENAL